MKHTLPGQMDLPETDTDIAGLVRKLASEPLRPIKPQVSCDHGLFSDEAAQIDLIEMLADPVNGDD